MAHARAGTSWPATPYESPTRMSYSFGSCVWLKRGAQNFSDPEPRAKMQAVLARTAVGPVCTALLGGGRALQCGCDLETGATHASHTERRRRRGG